MSEKKDFVTVGENRYPVIKTGRLQAEQVARIGRWIAKHGMRVAQDVSLDDLPGGDDSAGRGLQFILKFIEVIDADALVDLFYAVVGCTKEEAELYFDVAILIEVLVETFNRQPAVKRLIDRFFSTFGSTDETQEQSTPSEEPTDGQTK